MAASLLAGCGSKTTETTAAAENKTETTAGEAAAEKKDEAAGVVKVIEYDLTDEQYAFGVDKDQPELLEQVNAFIAKIQEDGTFDAICDKYFSDDEPAAVESAEYDASRISLWLRQTHPLSRLSMLTVTATRESIWKSQLCSHRSLARELVIENMDFDAVCLSVGQHKCDIAMAGLTINEEREEYVTFSDPYYKASQRLVTLADDTALMTVRMQLP